MTLALSVVCPNGLALSFILTKLSLAYICAGCIYSLVCECPWVHLLLVTKPPAPRRVYSNDRLACGQVVLVLAPY